MEKQKEFIEDFKELQRSNQESLIREVDKFESLFLLLTTGTITLSITFLTQVVTKHPTPFIDFFVLSLGCLFVSLLFQSLAFFTVIKHFIKMREQITRVFKESLETNLVRKIVEDNIYTKITYILNLVAVFFGFVGLFLFVWFGVIFIYFLSYLNLS